MGGRARPRGARAPCSSAAAARSPARSRGAARACILEPDDPRITGPVALRGRRAGGAKPGQAVVAEILRYPEHPRRTAGGAVLKVLGDPDDPRTEIEKILAVRRRRRGVPRRRGARSPPTCPPRCAEADRARPRATCATSPSPPSIPRPRATSTTPWRSSRCPTAATALWVAVADVSHYVREGTPDRHRGAQPRLQRLPAQPRHPHAARAAVGAHCSLVPEEDRLAMVVRIDFDRDANVVATPTSARR